jgi:heme exporter protein B
VTKIVSIIKKDLKMEFRKRECLTSMLFFGILVLVILNIAIGIGQKVDPSISGGILWVAIIFSAVLGLDRVFSNEKENRCIDGLLLSPVFPETIFIAKMMVNMVFMIIAEIILIPLFIVFYNSSVTLDAMPMLIAIVLLLNIGFSSVGTLLSAISSGTRRNDIMLPILLFPILIPLIAATVKSTSELLRGSTMDKYSEWLYLILAFDFIFFGSSYLLFEYVIKEG